MNKWNLKDRILLLLDTYKDDVFFGEEIEALWRRVQSVESTIIVVGQFSVGKSALLNALLGEKLLATRRIESTKVTTRICNLPEQEEKRIVLCYKNGDTRELPFRGHEDLDYYTTFQGSEETDDLQVVNLHWPLSFLDHRLILVDTPGANSLTKEAFSVTEQELQNAAAVLFLFNGQKGLDQTDFTLLSKLYKRRKKLFMVATHIDGLMEKDLQLVMDNVSHQLSEVFTEHETIQIYPVSSLQALEAKRVNDRDLLRESKIEELENALREYTKNQEYLVSEMESISYDLELLEESLNDSLKESEREKASKEQERLLRLERLRLLTKQEYDQVLQYGLDLLHSREQVIMNTLIGWKQQIDEGKKKNKKDLYQSFKVFKEKIVELSQLQMAAAEMFKARYLEHGEAVRDLYYEMIERFEYAILQLHQHVERVIEEEDNLFIDTLEGSQTNVMLHWPSFKNKIQQVSFHHRRSIEYDDEIFMNYERDKRELEDSLKLKEQMLAKITRERAQLKQREESSLAELKTKLDQKIREHGKKPEPREITKTKGMLFWKKEVVVGYDYSNQERWEARMSRIFQEYENERRQGLDYFFTQKKNAKDKEDTMQQDVLKLMDMQDQLEDRLLTELMTSIENQKEKAQSYYMQMEREIEDLWKIQERQVYEQFMEHTEHVREQFHIFIQHELEKVLADI